MKIFFKVALLYLLCIAACRDTAKNKFNTAEVTTQSKIEIVKLSEMDGQPIDMSQYSGKTVFINFWATWCKPCLQEMPSIQRMMEKLNGQNIVFLFASDEATEQIEGFKSRSQYSFHFVHAENPEELNIMSLPTTFIFDASGKLAYNEIGYHQWDDNNNIDLIEKIIKQE